jgi:uncharacterized membrane protein YkvA (DUF1232 family)
MVVSFMIKLSKNKNKIMENIESGLENIKTKASQFFRKSPRFEKIKELLSFYLRNPEKLNEIITDTYNRATQESENKTIGDMFDKFSAFYRMLTSSVKGEYKELPPYKVIIMVAALVYLISPYDFVPDNTPLIGAIDDLAVIAWLIKTANDEIVRYQEWESTNLRTITS